MEKGQTFFAAMASVLDSAGASSASGSATCATFHVHDTINGLALGAAPLQDTASRGGQGRVDGHDILLWTVRQRVERMEAGEGCLVHNLPSPLASTAGRIAQSGGKRDAELGIGRSRKTEEGGKDGSPTRHLPLRIGMEKKRHQHPQSCILPRAHTNRLIKFGWHRNGIISRRTRPWWGRMRPWLLLRRC